MRKIRFVQADVFSDSPFGGNPVVVVPDAADLTGEEMAALARGMAFAEMAFVVAPRDPNAAFALRCFTPTREVPLSGHQLLGAAFVLAELGRLDLSGEVTEGFVEVGGGHHAVVLKHPDGVVDYVAMIEPVVRFDEPHLEMSAASAALSLDPLATLRTQLPIQIVETGIACLLLPVDSLRTLRDLIPVPQRIDELLHDVEAQCLVAFSLETLSPKNNVHVRVFAPPLGISEDPATGTANAALAAYLVRHGAIQATPSALCRSEQGSEVGRPSIVETRVDVTTDPMTVVVGGRVARSIDGTVFF